MLTESSSTRPSSSTQDKLRADAERRSKIAQAPVDASNSSSESQNQTYYNVQARPSSDSQQSSNSNSTRFSARTTVSVNVSTTSVAARAGNEWELNKDRVNVSSDFSGQTFSRPRWIPDAERNHCLNCAKKFDALSRKHHCRLCGEIFCNNCCKSKLILPTEFQTKNPQRICLRCYPSLSSMQSDLIMSNSNCMKDNKIDLTSNRRYLNNPIATTLGSEIRKAAYTVRNMQEAMLFQDSSIPRDLINAAQGIAFLTVVKCGFLFAGKAGTGCVISKLLDGSWSCPSAIATLGLSWGGQVGGEITDYLIILNSRNAVTSFCSKGQLSIGAELGVAIGPIGRSGALDVHVGDEGLAAAYSYSHSRGLFAGVSLDGGVIFSRGDVNMNFYGRAAKPQELLQPDLCPSQGIIARPHAVEPLYQALEALLSTPDVPLTAPVHDNDDDDDGKNGRGGQTKTMDV